MKSSVEKGAKITLWPFILTFVAVCVIAAGYIAMWIANVALYGIGFSNSDMIKTTTGRIIASGVYSIILAACLFAIFFAIRMFMKKDHIAVSVSRISWLPRILSFFAIFSCVDAFVIFFFSTVGNSIVGEKLLLKNNYQLISTVTNFIGYDRLGLAAETAKLDDSVLAIVCAVLFGLLAVLFCALTFVVYSKIKAYFDILMNTYAGAQYDKDNKPPVILSFIIAVVYIALSVVSFISGNWVDAIIQIGTAMFLGALAWTFILVHKKLRASSAE